MLDTSLLDQLTDFVIGIDSQERIVVWNQAASNRFGYIQANILGQHLSVVLAPNALAQTLDMMYEHLQKYGYWEGELSFLNSTDEPLWHFTRASHLTLPGGNNGVLLQGMHLVDHEIRDHRVQSALDYSQRELSNILSAVGDLVCSYNPVQQTFDFISPSCFQLTGYSEFELMDHPALFIEMIEPQYRDTVVQTMRNAPNGQVTRLDYPIRRKDGETRWVLNSLTPVGDDESWHLICALTDTSAFRALNELKSRMIRMATHDLNNPLATAVGFFGLLADDLSPQLSDEHLNMIKSIHRSHDRMGKMLEELLDFEQLEAYDEPKVETVDFVRTVHTLIEEFSFQIQEKAHTVRFDPMFSSLLVRGDRVQIEHAMSNYISNAIKYTPAGGIITISLQHNTQQLVFEVQDNGLGIPENARPKLFETFFRAKQPGTEQIPGTGLGLSLVKSVIEQHGGAVYYRAEENGSTFGFWLPATVVVG